MESSIQFYISKARFQQKQLQEKEEKLLKLYEEQQERAMNRVGGRAHSGGTSTTTSSSVGRGKVRHMFQTRRGTSESRQGRDRSYPLEPLKSSLDNEQRKVPSSWTNASARALNRHNSDLQLRQYEDFFDEPEDYYRRGIVRRTHSQARPQKPKSKLIYFGGSQTDLHFSDESDYVQTFQVIDDHYEITDKKSLETNASYQSAKEDDYFINNFKNKRQFYENRLRSDSDLITRNADLFDKLPNVGMNRNNVTNLQRKESTNSRYKTFVSQKGFNEKPHLGKPETTARRETASPPINGNANKVRKPTPMPSTVAPKPHLLNAKRTSGVPVRNPPREVTPPVPASRTTVGRSPSAMQQSEKPPIGRKTQRVNPPTKAANQQSDLPGCQFCGRHFAEDRIGKHQEICKKSSSKTKRKPFDSVKQRVKGTEAEQFLKGGKFRNQQKPQVKVPQKDWRKTHEEFINSIRAAREYQVSTVQMRKPANSRPTTSSRY